MSTTTPQPQNTTPDAPPSIDDVLYLLKNERRRYTLFYLQHTEPPVLLGELSEQVAGWETNTHPDKISSKQRKRAYVSLYQQHLPKMHDLGIVQYNSTEKRITPGEYIDQVKYYMEGPLSDMPDTSADITRDTLKPTTTTTTTTNTRSAPDFPTPIKEIYLHGATIVSKIFRSTAQLTQKVTKGP